MKYRSTSPRMKLFKYHFFKLLCSKGQVFEKKSIFASKTYLYIHVVLNIAFTNLEMFQRLRKGKIKKIVKELRQNIR